MTAADLDPVLAIAEIVHPSYPEDLEVFIERLRLYPRGCQVLETGHGLAGYVVSHPWRHGLPPKLNQLLDQLPEQADTYYIHDIALLPATRGTGAAAAMVERLAECAESSGLPTLSLVAVNNSAGFWRRHGFHAVVDPAIDRTVKSYDQAACYMIRPIPASRSE